MIPDIFGDIRKGLRKIRIRGGSCQCLQHEAHLDTGYFLSDAEGAVIVSAHQALIKYILHEGIVPVRLLHIRERKCLFLFGRAGGTVTFLIHDLLDFAGCFLHTVFIRPHDEQFLRTAGEGRLHIAPAGDCLGLDIPFSAFGDLTVDKFGEFFLCHIRLHAVADDGKEPRSAGNAGGSGQLIDDGRHNLLFIASTLVVAIRERITLTDIAQCLVAV